ncbi:hypothetical protein DFH06DRAFT_1399920 [Mycena polygramma]|nr:hypothetical protein DFH06DRAFT_1399920 [Mycena polygramma]
MAVRRIDIAPVQRLQFGQLDQSSVRSITPDFSSVSLEDIDDEIAFHLEQVYNLRRRRNKLVPISRLPSELWEHIFYICAEEARQEYKLGLLYYFDRVFRNIRTHSYGGLQRLNQLRYCGEAPVTIKTSFYDSPWCTSILLQYTAQFFDVEIMGKADLILDLVSQLSRTELPILERLVLWPDSSSRHSGAVAGIFPDEIFQRAPRLRSLGLSGFALHWPTLRNLTDISLLSCLEHSTSSIPSFLQLLSTLQSSPALQTLELGHVIELVTGSDHPSIVSLLSLRTLTIHDEGAAATQLLLHLVFPPTARVSREIMAPLLAALRPHLRNPGAPISRLLTIDAPSFSALNLASHTHTTAPSLGERGGTALLHLYLNTWSEVSDIIAKALDVLPVAHITHLDARQADTLTPESWRALLPLMPNLHTVYLHLKDAALHLTTALREMTLSPAGCPVHIRNLHLDVFVSHGMGWFEGLQASAATRATLLEFVCCRSANGVPLERLDVVERSGGCMGMKEEEWTVLAGQVGELTRTSPLPF